jgi:hypothetical protein
MPYMPRHGTPVVTEQHHSEMKMTRHSQRRSAREQCNELGVTMMRGGDACHGNKNQQLRKMLTAFGMQGAPWSNRDFQRMSVSAPATRKGHRCDL